MLRASWNRCFMVLGIAGRRGRAGKDHSYGRGELPSFLNTSWLHWGHTGQGHVKVRPFSLFSVHLIAVVYEPAVLEGDPVVPRLEQTG